MSKSAMGTAVSSTATDPALPPRALLEQQADWLAHVRARLLRRVRIAGRRRILDLGSGYGAVSAELARRGGGRVIALDRQQPALASGEFGGAWTVRGDASRLPFSDAVFDLVFSQFALLWMNAVEVIGQVRRLLEPGGAFVLIEPDYGAMIEHPPSITTRSLWISGLTRAGADPLTGRKLPGLLARAGFDVRVDLTAQLGAPVRDRLALLRGLPLTATEHARLDEIEREDRQLNRPWDRIAHLPLFLVSAVTPAMDGASAR